ncbi:MAG: gamma-glutamylcyclotransferase family protein [Chloroflexales bacterium]
MMPYPFFVYGTLKPGEPNYTRFLAGRTVAEESASFVGAALYSAGAFPYLVTEPDLAAPAERVSGTIISVADEDYAATLAQLDGLEGYTQGGTNNTYERLLVTVDAAEGARPVWIYVAGTAIQAEIRAGHLPKIPGGHWQSDSAALRFWSER